MISVVETNVVESETQASEYEAFCIERGYEGAILRTATGLYEFGNRSHGLLKLKSFTDGEWPVCAIEGGRGKFADQAVFTCQMADGGTFNCCITGTQQERRDYLAHKDQYIGRLMTVKYFNMTPDGKPFLPVGKAFREAFDN